ncbi:hypothetical protein DPMN_161333 [Dreissena polymorpha]|uniref:Uncharacterized protein n=1 Tax=Dreissena polymorpha TaxID=45954 RepID=A0A9D4IPK5_DREPO|nr:hypothetical protein DPMN_161333 [Dreissena polymorpha]
MAGQNEKGTGTFRKNSCKFLERIQVPPRLPQVQLKKITRTKQQNTEPDRSGPGITTPHTPSPVSKVVATS